MNVTRFLLLTVAVLILSLFVNSTSSRNLLDSFPSTSLISVQAHRRLNSSHVIEGFVRLDGQLGTMHALFTDRAQNVQYEYDSQAQKTVMFTKTAPNKFVAMEIPSSEVVTDLRQALASARLLPVGEKVFDKEVLRCMQSSPQTWHTTFLGSHYVICKISDNEFQIVGKDLIARALVTGKAELRGFAAQAKRPTRIDAYIPISRSHLKRPASEASSVLEKPWFQNFEYSCNMKWIRSYQCEDEQRLHVPLPKKVCIFLHGAANEIIGEPTNNTWFDYWGDMESYTPQCSERWYIREDTVHFGWDDHKLQKKYCQLALIGQTNPQESGKPPIIRNKVIFAHSMANLILSAAIKHGYCDIDTKSTSWYSIQAPYMGSPAANYVADLCRNSSFYDLLYYSARWLNMCNATTLQENQVYHTLRHSYCSKDGLCVKELEKIARSRIRGSMCGDSAMGLVSSWGVTFYLLSTLVGFDEYNDGLVGVSSCQLEPRYESNPSANYYMASINHRDGTCFNGNGWLSRGRPCDFFTNKY